MMTEGTAEVAIVGGGWGGLVCGAALARLGVKSVIVEPTQAIGGRTSTMDYNGYALEFGPMEARGTSDIFFISSLSTVELLKERTGVDLSRLPTTSPKVRIHIVPDKVVLPLDEDPRGFRAWVHQGLGVPEGKVDAFESFLADLRDRPDERVDELQLMPFSDWLPTIDDEDFREALSRWAIAECWIPAVSISAGKFIQKLKVSDLFYALPDDSDPPGVSAYSEPFANVYRELGGEIRLRTKVREIVVENGAVQGIVVIDEHTLAEFIPARHVVYSDLAYDIFDVLGEEHFPDSFVAGMRRLEQWGTYGAGCYFGLERLPTIRESGQPEDFPGWNRRIVSPDDPTGTQGYGGGWYIPSINLPAVAPSGKQLVQVGAAFPGRPSFEELRRKIDGIVAYMRDYYSDFDEIVVWSRYFAPEGVYIKDFGVRAAPRAEVKSPHVDGLYFVESTSATEAFYFFDVDAEAAVRSADHIAAELKG